ncbi:MAG TPA: hypothetical protein P5244_11020, partial [Syntrophales bacterium]|nr:hypothetical protein [Syntrophales bacterium]
MQHGYYRPASVVRMKAGLPDLLATYPCNSSSGKSMASKRQAVMGPLFERPVNTFRTWVQDRLCVLATWCNSLLMCSGEKFRATAISAKVFSIDGIFPLDRTLFSVIMIFNETSGP